MTVDETRLAISAEPLVPGWVRRSPRGDLDLTAAPWFKQRLIGELDGNEGVLLDLASVDFIGSTGLALIMAGVCHADSVAGPLECAQPLPAQARRLLEISGRLPRLMLRPA